MTRGNSGVGFDRDARLLVRRGFAGQLHCVDTGLADAIVTCAKSSLSDVQLNEALALLAARCSAFSTPTVPQREPERDKERETERDIIDVYLSSLVDDPLRVSSHVDLTRFEACCRQLESIVYDSA